MINFFISILGPWVVCLYDFLKEYAERVYVLGQSINEELGVHILGFG